MIYKINDNGHMDAAYPLNFTFCTEAVFNALYKLNDSNHDDEISIEPYGTPYRQMMFC